MPTTHHIALIPGDGIGVEVVAAATRVLEAAGRHEGIGFDWVAYGLGM